MFELLRNAGLLACNMSRKNENSHCLSNYMYLPRFQTLNPTCAACSRLGNTMRKKLA